jgi:hypothetical protein
MNWKEKFDNFWVGLLVGILVPAFFFLCYWLFFYSYMNFPRAFMRYLIGGDLLSNTIKLCALGNLLIFYGFLNAKLTSGAKGIIASIFVYLALVLYVIYYIEKGTIF